MSRHLEYWNNLERTNFRLWVGFWAMTVVAVVEGWSLGRPIPVHIVPGAAVPGISRPGVGLESAAQDYAHRYVLTVGNFTPETARKVYTMSLQYLTPEAASEVRVRMAEELTRIEREKISSEFALAGEVAVHTHDGILLATVPGRKKVYAGKTLLTEKPAVYQVTLVPVPPSDTNPYGVRIAAATLTDTPAETQKGGRG